MSRRCPKKKSLSPKCIFFPKALKKLVAHPKAARFIVSYFSLFFLLMPPDCTCTGLNIFLTWFPKELSRTSPGLFDPGQVIWLTWVGSLLEWFRYRTGYYEFTLILIFKVFLLKPGFLHVFSKVEIFLETASEGFASEGFKNDQLHGYWGFLAWGSPGPNAKRTICKFWEQAWMQKWHKNQERCENT